ncbi:MAG: hypothetical protein PHS41_08670 [Victivallaceae bacterium]|nr:hypothetical protein [Victivallaceae bacterium]
MKITYVAPNFDPALRLMAGQIRDKEKFVLLWANAAAMEARAAARRKGGRNYWRELARRTYVRKVDSTTAEVSSDQIGANLKQYGGIVRPVKAKALTIPVSPEAKGKRAAELENSRRRLFVLPGSRLLGYSKGRGKKKDFVPLFLLVPQVTAKPDRWFPSDEKCAELGRREAAWLLQKEGALWNT